MIVVLVGLTVSVMGWLVFLAWHTDWAAMAVNLLIVAGRPAAAVARRNSGPAWVGCPSSDQRAGPSPDRKEYLEEGEVKPQVFLSAEEERDLARRCRQGDETAGHKLAHAYRPLVKRIAVQYMKKYFGSWEDLVSEGWVGLLKAIRGFGRRRNERALDRPV